MQAREIRSPPRAPLPARTPLLAVGLCCAALVGACGNSKGTTATTAGKPATATTSTGLSGEAAPSHALSDHVVTATAGGVTATMTAAGHTPRVGVRWPIGFAVEKNGKPAKAEVRYQYLFAGAVVAHRSRYRFTGHFHDTFQWPASAVGYPLTFRAVIRSEEKTLNLDYPVQVGR